MYISHPFYSCFNSLSGPFRNYACRSCLLKLVLINCILWKSAECTFWNCIIRFFAFFDYFEVHPIYVLMPWRGHFASRHLILLYKTSNLMKKWQQWVFNVMYYSTIYIVFKEIVLLFLPFVLYIFLLEWSCRANKAALIFFFFFFTYSHINLLFRNSVFHLRHFDSLSLQIIIIIKKMFSKSLTVFCLCKMLKIKLFALLGEKAWTKTPRGIISSFLWWEGVYLIY